MIKSALILLLLGTMCMACEIPLGSNSASEQPSGLIALQTDQAIYQAVPREDGRAIAIDIQLTFTNTAQAPVYFTGCHPPHASVMEKKEGNDWNVVFSPIVLLCLSPPVEVQPGDSIMFASPVYACFLDQSCSPKITADAFLPDNTFRLRQQISWDKAGRELIPESMLVSNTFEITF